MKNLIVLSILLSTMSMSCSDQCKQNDCSYHGYCLDGNCNCDEGYSGESCHISITPSAVKLNEISILSFPSTQNGESWDSIGVAGKPDVYFKLYMEEELLYKGVKIEENIELGHQKCTEKVKIILSNYNKTYTLKLYDKDEGAIVDEYMCSLSFKLDDLAHLKQEHVSLNDGETQIDFGMSFVY